jgi:hypothetical protein
MSGHPTPSFLAPLDAQDGYSVRVASAMVWKRTQRAVLLVLYVICVVQAVLLRHSEPENRPQVYYE